MANKRGRPPIRCGEQSSTLSVRVTESSFDDLCKFSRQLDVSLPQAARIKLDSVSLSEEEVKDLLVESRREAKKILAEARSVLEEDREILSRIAWSMNLFATSRSDEEARRIAKHLAFILSQKYTH